MSSSGAEKKSKSIRKRSSVSMENKSPQKMVRARDGGGKFAMDEVKIGPETRERTPSPEPLSVGEIVEGRMEYNKEGPKFVLGKVIEARNGKKFGPEGGIHGMDSPDDAKSQKIKNLQSRLKKRKYKARQQDKEIEALKVRNSELISENEYLKREKKSVVSVNFNGTLVLHGSSLKL